MTPANHGRVIGQQLQRNADQERCEEGQCGGNIDDFLREILNLRISGICHGYDSTAATAHLLNTIRTTLN